MEREKGKVIQMFKDLRKGQARELNKFCKEYAVCDRCHNPEHDLVEGSTKCQSCLDYMKTYAKNKRITDAIIDREDSEKDEKDKHDIPKDKAA